MALFKKAGGPKLFFEAKSSSRVQTFAPPLPQVVEGIRLPVSLTASILNRTCTYLDKGSRVNGELNFDGPVQIDGEIEGEINSKDSVVIGEGAIVSANINAMAIVVAGAISGELSASQRIELYPSAKVLLGSLIAPEMVICEGALIEGTRITKAPREES